MPTLLPTIKEEDNLPWTRLMWRYRLQFQAMAAAAVIFIAGGMKLAWSTFEMPASKCDGNDCTHQLTVMWFIGCIFGVCAAATFVQNVTKNFAYSIGGFLLIIGGTLCIAMPKYPHALFVSCLCEGCAYGLAQVQALVTAGELAHKDIRGLLVSSERTFLWLGVCLQLCLTHLWFSFEPVNGYAMYIDQFHGIIVTCLGLGALILTLTQRIESPILLMHQQQRDILITYVLKRLLGTHYPTTEVVHMREDCRQYLIYDINDTRNIVGLLKVLLIRCIVTLALTLPFNQAFLTVSWNGYGCDMNCMYLLAISGVIGCIAGGLLIDKHGRRKLTVLSLLLAGIFIFIVGGIFRHMQSSQEMLCILDLRIVATLMLFFQIVICAGVGVASAVYLAEAFPVRLKAKSIALVLVLEQVLQIMLAKSAHYSDYNYSVFFFTIGTVCLITGLFVFLFMPETMYLSLYECLLKFNKLP